MLLYFVWSDPLGLCAHRRTHRDSVGEGERCRELPCPAASGREFSLPEGCGQKKKINRLEARGVHFLIQGLETGRRERPN